MKKIILLLLVLLLLAGCDKGIKNEKRDTKNEFNCFKSISDNLNIILYEIYGEYQNDILTNIKNVFTIKFTEKDDSNFELFKSYVESMKMEYDDKVGVVSILTSNKNEIILNTSYDVLSMSKDEIVNNNFDKDYSTLIKKYQENGYTCK